jgi:hypothetical protein
MVVLRQTLGLFAVAAFLALLTGCQTTQPHVTAKVIFQQDDLTAELATEWR